MTEANVSYPMGSVSRGTLRVEDLVLTFSAQLCYNATSSVANGPSNSR
jgi:hypothetical protein